MRRISARGGIRTPTPIGQWHLKPSRLPFRHSRVRTDRTVQHALVDQATEEFILGLIHSDGCRVVANDRGVRSIRYHFSNRSEDIIGLFTTALDALDIP